MNSLCPWYKSDICLSCASEFTTLFTIDKSPFIPQNVANVTRPLGSFVVVWHLGVWYLNWVQVFSCPNFNSNEFHLEMWKDPRRLCCQRASIKHLLLGTCHVTWVST